MHDAEGQKLGRKKKQAEKLTDQTGRNVNQSKE